MTDSDQQLQDYPPSTATGGEYEAARVAASIPPRHRNPRSTASIAGHPLHPMLTPSRSRSLSQPSFAMSVSGSPAAPAGSSPPCGFGAGLIFAVLAAVAGLTDVIGDPQIRALSVAWWHAGGNVLAVLIEIANFFLRFAEGSVAVLPTGIILSAIVVCILSFTGWKGWEMVYRGHVGVAD